MGLISNYDFTLRNVGTCFVVKCIGIGMVAKGVVSFLLFLHSKSSYWHCARSSRLGRGPEGVYGCLRWCIGRLVRIRRAITSCLCKKKVQCNTKVHFSLFLVALMKNPMWKRLHLSLSPEAACMSPKKCTNAPFSGPFALAHTTQKERLLRFVIAWVGLTHIVLYCTYTYVLVCTVLFCYSSQRMIEERRATCIR